MTDVFSLHPGISGICNGYLGLSKRIILIILFHYPQSSIYTVLWAVLPPVCSESNLLSFLTDLKHQEDFDTSLFEVGFSVMLLYLYLLGCNSACDVHVCQSICIGNREKSESRLRLQVRDVTFVNQEGVMHMICMSSAGHMYWQPTSEESRASLGTFYITNTLEVLHPEIQVRLDR